jgi:oxalate decarboxylase
LREINPQTNQFPHKYRLDASPALAFPGGELRIVSQKEFPIQNTLTGVTMLLKPGALREMHWHPNADEWQFYLSGRARVTIFGAHGRTKTKTFAPGEVAFIKQGFGHFVEQIGDEPTKVLILQGAGLRGDQHFRLAGGQSDGYHYRQLRNHPRGGR